MRAIPTMTRKKRHSAVESASLCRVSCYRATSIALLFSRTCDRAGARSVAGGTRTRDPLAGRWAQLSVSTCHQSSAHAVSHRRMHRRLGSSHVPILMQVVYRRQKAASSVPPSPSGKPREKHAGVVISAQSSDRNLQTPARWPSGRGAVLLAKTSPANDLVRPIAFRPAETVRLARQSQRSQPTATMAARDCGGLRPRRGAFAGQTARTPERNLEHGCFLTSSRSIRRPGYCR